MSAAVKPQRLPDGRISHEFKRPRPDGATHAILSPIELLEKLAALVPPPRSHLVRYYGILAPHRDLRGKVYFPIQVAAVLSEAGPAGFAGGAFILTDVPERRNSSRRKFPAGLGDAILFCTRERLVRIGGAYGLQPVMHGVEPIESGTRFVLGMPLHEFA